MQDGTYMLLEAMRCARILRKCTCYPLPQFRSNKRLSNHKLSPSITPVCEGGIKREKQQDTVVSKPGYWKSLILALTDMSHYTHGTSNIWLVAPPTDSAPCSGHPQLNVNHKLSSTFRASYCSLVTEVLSLSNAGLHSISFYNGNRNNHRSTF